MKGRIRKPSPALIVAVGALVVALTGTAVGLPGKAKVDKNDLRKNTVGAKQLKANAVGNSEMALFKSSALFKLSAAGSQAAASPTVLLSRDALQIYAKCFLDAGVLFGEIYLRTTAPGGILESDGFDENGSGVEPGDGYVNPGEDEEEHEITSASVAANSADGDAENFFAVQGGTAIQGYAGAFVKQGVLPAGDGPYGAGSRCIFHAFYGGAG